MLSWLNRTKENSSSTPTAPPKTEIQPGRNVDIHSPELLEFSKKIKAEEARLAFLRASSKNEPKTPELTLEQKIVLQKTSNETAKRNAEYKFHMSKLPQEQDCIKKSYSR